MPDTEEGKIIEEDTLFVLDTTATQESGSRTHDMLVDGRAVPVKFDYGVPKELPFGVAMRFLKTPEFQLTDKDGKPRDFQRVPIQPDELGAGERFRLAEDETVAKYNELTVDALVMRAVLLPGGEKMSKRFGKDAIVEFIQTATAERRKANTVNEANPDEFLPEADASDDNLQEVAA